MAGVARKHGIGAGIGIADGDRVGEDLLHARIGLKGLALDDADGGDQAARFGIRKLDGFFLDQAVEALIKTEVVGWNGLVLRQPDMLVNSVFGGLSFFASG